MEINYEGKGKEYYTLISNKNQDYQNYLHPDVELYGPLANLKGKEAVITSTGNFMKVFHSLKIRSSFGSDRQAVLVYDVDIPGISAHFPGVSLLTFEEGLIVRIELFYDGTPFSPKKKEEIFST